jgi:mRNA interferase MazF
MTSGTTIRQRDILLIPFPFTDFSNIKIRPVLVLSNKHFHLATQDIICCAITSNPKSKGISISGEDIETGNLPSISKIKPTKVMTINTSQIIKVIGRLTNVKTQQALEHLSSFISLS